MACQQFPSKNDLKPFDTTRLPVLHRFIPVLRRILLMKPFKGILYNTDKADGIADLVCPPYDVIENTDPYYARSPFNAIRLELPRDLPDTDRYQNAKNTMHDWLSQGILVPDPHESVYVYEQEFTVDSGSFLRTGFISLQRLDKKRILTHEQTRKKAKADREQLIGTLKTYTSFIFGLYDDKEKRYVRPLIVPRAKLSLILPTNRALRPGFTG